MAQYMTEQFRLDLIAFMKRHDANGVWSDGDCRTEGVEPLTPARAVPIVVRWAADEILADVARGVVPGSVVSFSQLHDHVDANGYGGAFDWPGPWPCDEPGDEPGEAYVNDHCQFWNEVQSRLDAWIQAGGLAAHRLPDASAG